MNKTNITNYLSKTLIIPTLITMASCVGPNVVESSKTRGERDFLYDVAFQRDVTIKYEKGKQAIVNEIVDFNESGDYLTNTLKMSIDTVIKGKAFYGEKIFEDNEKTSITIPVANRSGYNTKIRLDKLTVKGIYADDVDLDVLETGDNAGEISMKTLADFGYSALKKSRNFQRIGDYESANAHKTMSDKFFGLMIAYQREYDNHLITQGKEAYNYKARGSNSSIKGTYRGAPRTMILRKSHGYR